MLQMADAICKEPVAKSDWLLSDVDHIRPAWRAEGAPAAHGASGAGPAEHHVGQAHNQRAPQRGPEIAHTGILAPAADTAENSESVDQPDAQAQDNTTNGRLVKITSSGLRIALKRAEQKPRQRATSQHRHR